MAKDKDYEVGRGKPPRHTQFKPGQSGNPSGRPRKVLTDDELLLRHLAGKVSIMEGGRKRRISRLEAMIIQQIRIAMKGDARAFKHIIQAYREAMLALTPVPEEVMKITLVFEEEEERKRQAELERRLREDDDPFAE